ncbi:MAG: hypothetical protein ACOC2H_01085 [Spirochaetota bacterium]
MVRSIKAFSAYGAEQEFVDERLRPFERTDETGHVTFCRFVSVAVVDHGASSRTHRGDPCRLNQVHKRMIAGE